jgi:hypothetical protein
MPKALSGLKNLNNRPMASVDEQQLYDVSDDSRDSTGSNTEIRLQMHRRN